jgi:hypothetical protein
MASTNQTKQPFGLAGRSMPKFQNMINLPTLALLLALVFTSCERTTMVSGRITNARTAQPLAGIKVTMFASNGHEPRDSPNPKIVGEVSTLTDSTGGYALEYSGRGIDGVSLQLGQGIYCAEYFDVDKSQYPAANECKEVNMQVSEIDGRLNVILKNLTGLTDSLFLRVDCDGIGPKGIFCCEHHGLNTVPVGEADTIVFPVSADRFVPVYWGTSKFDGWDAPRVDSVFCAFGEATPIVISF